MFQTCEKALLFVCWISGKKFKNVANTWAIFVDIHVFSVSSEKTVSKFVGRSNGSVCI